MKIWSVIYPILLYYAGCSIGSLFFSVGVPMLVGVCVIFPIFKSENVRISMSGTQKKDIPLLIILAMAAALCFNILFALLQITGSSQQYAEVADKQFALPLWAGILIYGVISPVAEEMVFRGIVYKRLDRLFGRTIAIVGSSLLFGAYHGNLVQALYGFILGLLIVVLYERYGSFAVPVLVHSTANICVYILSSDAMLQQKFMSWTGCIVCSMLTIVLFWLLVLRKEK